MKLIIDIPDYEYRQIKEIYEKNDIVEATYSYIYHGTPLDDLKAEIKAIKINGQVDEHTMFIRTSEQVKSMTLEIIDKHIGKAEKEGGRT